MTWTPSNRLPNLVEDSGHVVLASSCVGRSTSLMEDSSPVLLAS